MAEDKKKQLVRTFGISYYGEDSKTDKALSVDYLEASLRIAIHSPAGKDSKTKYDYNSGQEIYLREKGAKALSKILTAAIHERDKGNEIPSLAVSSASSLIEVCAGKKYGVNTDICIVIHNEIDPETKKSSKSGVFGFRNQNVIKDYNPEEGTYESIAIDSDLQYFLTQINEFVKSSTGAISHNLKKEQKFDMDRIIMRQLDIAKKLGISYESAYQSKKSWDGSANNGGGHATMLSSTSDILSELDDLQ